MKKPLIGIILDQEEGAEGKYSVFPFYALRQNYFDAVERAGGVPFAIPYANSSIENYLSILDGLIIAGGNFDIPPEFYGENKIHETVTTKRGRTDFEFGMTRKFIDSNKAVLGICGGMQLINVVCGGSLIQDIPSEVKNSLKHEVKDRTKPAHKIKIKQGSFLNSIVGKTEFGVNTAHHQAVKEPAKNLIASAMCEDGIIEAIEAPDKKFVLGTQWHPEYLICEEDVAMFKKFVESCK